jgi:hypothetical protein
MFRGLFRRRNLYALRGGDEFARQVGVGKYISRQGIVAAFNHQGAKGAKLN